MSRLDILRGLEIIQSLISNRTTDCGPDNNNVSCVLITAHAEVAFGLALSVEADEIQQKVPVKRHSLSWRPGLGHGCPVIQCHGVDLLNGGFFMPRSCVGEGRLLTNEKHA